MKVAAFLIDEIRPKDIKHSLGHFADDGKKWIVDREYALYYGNAVILLRRILEVLVQLGLYTRQWKKADVLILLSGVCACCDDNINILETIEYVQKQGFEGKIVAVIEGGGSAYRKNNKFEGVTVIFRDPGVIENILKHIKIT